MALKSLGKVIVVSAGTPERITKNLSTPSARLACQSVTISALPGNSGTSIYIGSSVMDKSTGAGVYLIIAKGSVLTQTIALAPAGLMANEIYIDADTTNDAAYISVAEQ